MMPLAPTTSAAVLAITSAAVPSMKPTGQQPSHYESQDDDSDDEKDSDASGDADGSDDDDASE